MIIQVWINVASGVFLTIREEDQPRNCQNTEMNNSMSAKFSNDNLLVKVGIIQQCRMPVMSKQTGEQQKCHQLNASNDLPTTCHCCQITLLLCKTFCRATLRGSMRDCLYLLDLMVDDICCTTHITLDHNKEGSHINYIIMKLDKSTSLMFTMPSVHLFFNSTQEQESPYKLKVLHVIGHKPTAAFDSWEEEAVEITTAMKIAMSTVGKRMAILSLLSPRQNVSCVLKIKCMSVKNPTIPLHATQKSPMTKINTDKMTWHQAYTQEITLPMLF